MPSSSLDTLLRRTSSWLRSAGGSQCQVCGQWQGGALCQACRAGFDRQRLRCGVCALGLPRQAPPPEAPLAPVPMCGACLRRSPPFNRAVAALDYGFPWSGLILQLKHSASAQGASLLADVLADAVRHAYRDTEAAPAITGPLPVDLIVPVPLSDERLRQRGHNQSWELARRLGRSLRLPARADLVMRWPAALPQQQLDRAARRANIRGAFSMIATPTSRARANQPAGGAGVSGLRVAVVDDVMTTGATLEELAATLRNAGAAEVHAWVLARTPA